MMLQKVYILKAFDTANFRQFTPTPAVFVSKERMDRFIRESTDKTVLFSYDVVLVNNETK